MDTAASEGRLAIFAYAGRIFRIEATAHETPTPHWVCVATRINDEGGLIDRVDIPVDGADHAACLSATVHMLITRSDDGQV